MDRERERDVFFMETWEGVSDAGFVGGDDQEEDATKDKSQVGADEGEARYGWLNFMEMEKLIIGRVEFYAKTHIL